MGENRFRRRGRPQERQPHPNSGERIQFLVGAEEQILRSISAYAPLPEVLNEICRALDCQIGNLVSLISVRNDDATYLAAIALNASLFGMHPFCSAGIVGENDELLGSLELYCCVPRHPSSWEFQLIERATYLAAIAITHHKEAGPHGNGAVYGKRLMRGHVFNRFPN